MRPHDRSRLRAEVNRARRLRPAERRRHDDSQRMIRGLSLVETLVTPGETIACYLSQGAEPATLTLAARLGLTYRILVPRMSRMGAAIRPDWAWYHPGDRLICPVYAIPEPTTPPLGNDVLAQARLILAPALMAGEDGSRLGTGGGWYDRALAAHRGIPIAALLNDDEVGAVDQCEHDIPVDWIVTPTRTIRCTG